MRIIVIGGSGHIGSYLIPRLVESGHDIISISRGQKQPYQSHNTWKFVKQVMLDRKSEEATDNFVQKIVELKPEIVIDLICFKKESASLLVNALRGKISHFLHCGTIWVHGFSAQVPTTEEQPRNPIGEYGLQKSAIETYLLNEARMNDFPATVLHPGHIVGVGWIPINPTGNLNINVFEKLFRGEEVALPNLGLETLHHVHADDVAQSFMQAINHWSQSVGESFHVVSPQALTLRGYADAVANWFGHSANLRFMSWEQWCSTVSKEDAADTLEHISRSPNCSIQKAQKYLQYQPRYTSLEAIHESVNWLIHNKQIQIG